MNPNSTAGTRQDESIFGKLSPATRRTVEALIRSPLGKQALQDIESQSVAQRRAVLARIDQEVKSYGSAMAALEGAAAVAVQRLQQAEQALREARAACTTAQMAGYGAQLRHEKARRDLEIELMRGADERLHSFHFEVSNLITRDLAVALRFWPDLALKPSPGFSQQSNSEDVEAARIALQAAVQQTEAAMQKAMTYDEASEALRALCATLAQPLAKIELNPPQLTAGLADVGRPIDWRGHSEWEVTEVPAETTADRESKSLADKLKIARNLA